MGGLLAAEFEKRGGLQVCLVRGVLKLKQSPETCINQKAVELFTVHRFEKAGAV